MKRVVIGLSGGMDSTTLLGHLLEQGADVHCCVFTYGSKHNKYENLAADRIISFYQGIGMPVSRHFFDLKEVFSKVESNLLLSGGDIPEGHFESDVMKKTIVPGRNLIFGSIMTSVAESIGADEIALGVHSGDHHIYPDCRPEFIKAMDLAIFLSSDKKVQVTTPFVGMNKTSILELGYEQGLIIPYDMTRTCYKDQTIACGKCGSCMERLEAFKNLGEKDPIKYETT